MSDIKQLSRAIRFALFAGATLAVAPAFSQTADSAESSSEETQRLDVVQVTGTRLSSPGIVASSPITEVTAEELEIKQVVAIEDFLRELPALVPAIGPGTNNGSGGGATIDLRGLGANRTLVLVNGRRLTPFDLAGVVDTNAIPVALIERVEIISGGASAVYGADAVSGVVNFILKRDYEGAEISAQWGQSADKDGDRQRIDVTVGGNFAEGRGNAVLSVGHTDTDEVLQGNRPFGLRALSSVTGSPQGSGTGVPVTELTLGGLCPDGAFRATCNNAFNFNPPNLFQTPLNRLQATGLASFLINDDHEAYAEIMYVRSDVFTQLASSGTFFNNYRVPVGNPYLPAAARQQLCTIAGVAAADCVVGNPTEATVSLGRRFTELGPRLNSFENKLFQGTVGVKGYVFDTWRYDAYYSFGEADQLQSRVNWGSNSRVQQALRALSTTACTDARNGCVPLNVFGPEGSITPAMLRFINLDSLLQQTVTQDVLAGSLVGDLGDAIMSPWATFPINVAVGAEHRSVTAGTKSDQASQIQGEVLGTGAPTPDRRGGFELTEGYFELIAPIVNDAAWAYSLSFEGGFRRSTFETAGNSTSYNTYKYGGEWTPVEGIRFRALQQRATRAPNVGELFNPQVTGLSNLAVDPCGGATPTASRERCLATGVPAAAYGSLPQPSAGQVNVLTGGNPNLGPEIADTRTIGIVWTPSFVENLAITLDHYDIEVTGAVSSPSVNDILTGCYTNGNAADCALIGRNPLNGTFNGTEARGIALVSSNLGVIQTDGIDLGVTYLWDLGDFGRLDFGLNATKVNDWFFQATPTSVNRDCKGYYSVACNNAASNGAGIVHDFKANFRTTWVYSDFSVSANIRHLGSITEEPGGTAFLPAYSSIGSFNYLDLGASWQATDQIRLNLSIANVTDRQPPIVGNTIGNTGVNSGNTFPQYYDTIGRYYTFGATVKF
ncbi:TonB-dependent receptor [Silanimonas sp.]|uniref:TonB-dependent receptor plug domain-containing protein n=1 Tax=Silanimonas sp. TaxID=1929290 RepID=UPI0022BC506B|nr:TonB-dependent receptor [Silanimonas sp.]MCZ8166009.1 TonB-dependent receptor [Silanimonas sp.]